MNSEEALSLVYSAIQQVNEMRSPEEQIPATSDVKLVGDDGILDSLALTTLILALEEGLREETGTDISIIGEDSFDNLAGQFGTPSTIAELIITLV